MPVNPKHAEEYELPQIGDGGSDAFESQIGQRSDRLRRDSGSEEKPDRDEDGDETDDRPLLGSAGVEDGEQVGKGTKIDQLIARVSAPSADWRPDGVTDLPT
jgi:hypothetical protein